MALAIVLFVACSGEKENGDEPDSPELSIDLKGGTLQFSATGAEKYVITVNTNQEKWTARSNQTWCEVSESGNKFTVTASKNITSQPLTATITVSAGNAEDKVITVNQNAAIEDKGTALWDDTHWRWLRLEGKVATMELHHGEMYEFNSSGRLTLFDNHTMTYEYSYDEQGRLITFKSTDINIDPSPSTKRKRSVAMRTSVETDSNIYSEEYIYGNNNKYWPVFINVGDAEKSMFGDENRRTIEIPMLVKGIVSYKAGFEGSISDVTLHIVGNQITARKESVNSMKGIRIIEEITVDYVGDYPTQFVRNITEILEEEGEENAVERKETYTFKYGKNNKYAEVTQMEEDPSTPDADPVYVYINKYVVDNTIYHLLEEESDEEKNYILKFVYDDKGRVVRETMNDEEYTYTYEDDKHGNWIKKNIFFGNTSPEPTNRTITYHP